MSDVAVIDPRDITITPVFKIIELENIPKSEAAGRLVMETKEVVEVRFAGSRNYSPVFPAGAFWRREGNRVITYAERWAEEYAAFKNGDQQEARGTPLEMLRDYGITPELISLCRALRIYSIEALEKLEGQAVKSLGMNANRLKDAAREFMRDRMTTSTAMDEIEVLKAEIAALKAQSTHVPIKDSKPEDIAAAVEKADAEFAGMTDDDIKEEIATFTGSKPRGAPRRETLEQTLREHREAEAA